MSKPDEQVLLDNLGKIAFSLDKAYISRLSADYGVLYFDEKYNKEENICFENNIRAVKVERWVFDRDEKPGESFKNILSAFADGDHSIALVVKRMPTCTEMYFVIKNEGAARNEDSRENASLLESSIKGNFQGTNCKIIDIDEMESLFSFTDKIEVDGKERDAITSIALLTNTPSEFSEDYIGQGLEKVLNGVVPEAEEDSYTIVFLAESMSLSDIRDIISGYEEMATAIVPFLQYQFQCGISEIETHGEMKSISDTESISNSVFKTHSINIGANGGVSRSRSTSMSDVISKVTGKDLKGVTSAGLEIILGAVGGAIAGPPGAAIGGVAGKVLGTAAPNIARSKSEVKTQTNTAGSSLGLSAGYGYSWGASKTVANSQTKTQGTSSSISKGTSESTTYTYKSYLVADLLMKLEETIERINKSQATGLWKYSTYVLAGNSKITKNVANYLRGITQGKDSYNEPAYVQEWSKQEGNNATAFGEIKKYISRFTHPIFLVAGENNQNAMMLTPTSYVATDELSHVVVFPRKSLQGLPVLEGVEFGREPHSLIPIDSDLELGNGYHMHHEVKSQRIKISKEELTKHTFITGSTGSGKSNTVYQIINKISNEDVKFMVIEPAKGEYKKRIGAKCNVYGTNSQETDLLYINPFSFPEGIHVLEHIDRLVEILNACWPMYAAMPAVLKDAIERIYVNRGWNLRKSKCCFDGKRHFPTFTDLVITLPEVMEESSYSGDTKSDYAGALMTRIKSLTNGINGQLLCNGVEISNKDLFEENVIVDLSRIGSMETRSFFMGILIMKLQEYHMDKGEMNEKLRHITILEEAHNLLRRTSINQPQESSNLQGKSVEMLTNSIAEMRAYGEGFVIVDQAPGLLDEAVIRNTNTKIILRLPDAEDREIVGRSVALSDEQIREIAKLPKGVAVVYQNDWIEAVLCQFDEFKEKNEYKKERKELLLPQEIFCRNVFKDNGFKELKSKDIDAMLIWIDNSQYTRETKRIMKKALLGDSLNKRERQLIAYNVFEGVIIGKLLGDACTEKEGIEKADHFISSSNDITDREIVKSIRQMIIQMIISENESLDEIKRYIEHSERIR